MRKMETNDWIILNNIIYKIHTTECFNDMRYELLDQLKMVLDFDSADFYMAAEAVRTSGLGTRSYVKLKDEDVKKILIMCK